MGSQAGRSRSQPPPRASRPTAGQGQRSRVATGCLDQRRRSKAGGAWDPRGQDLGETDALGGSSECVSETVRHRTLVETASEHVAKAHLTQAGGAGEAGSRNLAGGVWDSQISYKARWRPWVGGAVTLGMVFYSWRQEWRAGSSPAPRRLASDFTWPEPRSRVHRQRIVPLGVDGPAGTQSDCGGAADVQLPRLELWTLVSWKSLETSGEGAVPLGFP